MQHRADNGYVDAWEDARLPLALIELAVRFLSVTVEVFLRRNFGERYLSGPAIVGGGFAIHFVTHAAAGQPPFEPAGASLGSMLFLWTYLSLCAGHKLVIWRRDRTGERWYSHSDGTSRRFWNLLRLPPRLVQMYLEPGLVAAAGLGLSFQDNVLGAYLCWTGLAFFVKGQMMHRRRRRAWLDYVDRTIEAQELHAALVEQRPARETRGFVVTTGAARHRRTLLHMEQVLRDADPLLSSFERTDAVAAEPAAPTNGAPAGPALDPGLAAVPPVRSTRISLHDEPPRHEVTWAEALSRARKRRRRSNGSR